jgi:hypothetical protein
MKVNNIIFMMGLLIGLIGLTTQVAVAQISVCNTDANFTATATSTGGASTMDYILVQPDGTTIEASNNTGTFVVPADGVYTLYAANHDGTANITVVPPTGACLETVTQTVTISSAACPPPPAGVSACENESVTSTATAASGATNLDYMLVCGGTVISTNTTGTFDLEALGVSPGICDLYAVNHDGTANLTTVPPSGTCLEMISRPVIVLESTNALCDISIPVELLSFIGQAEGKFNGLYWTTASEINSDYFDVEHSKDGTEFTYLGTMKAQGESAIETDYRLMDQEPFDISYYRLKMVDLNESYEYSNVVLIKRELGNSLTISNIRPVPTINKAIIEFTSYKSGTVDFSITDVTGKLLDKTTIEVVEGENEYTHDFSKYPSAVYIITLNNEHSRDVKRMIKKED